MPNKAEILIIDDEPQIRKLLQINMEANGYKTNLAVNGEEGLLMAANHPPDLILLDIGLPDKNGQDVLKELRQWYSNAIIILSVVNREKDIVQALDNGATDYLTKPFRTGELLARIRSSLRTNQTSENNPVVKVGAIEIDFVKRVVKKDDEIINLTSTEYNLLALFVKNEGMVLTHQYILKEVWGVAYQTETQYLRVFVAQLRKKLEENPNRPKHFITVSGVGYRFC